MRDKVIKRLLPFFFAASLVTTPVFAQSEDCQQDTAVGYCWCIYETTLKDLMETQGNDQASIKQRLSATEKALKKCLNRGSGDAIDGINNTH